MTEQEERDLARQIADGSEVFDFETALELVKFSPDRAERLIRNRRERKRMLDELARANERLHRSAREFR
jgi:hypothetical protein